MSFKRRDPFLLDPTRCSTRIIEVIQDLRRVPDISLLGRIIDIPPKVPWRDSAWDRDRPEVTTSLCAKEFGRIAFRRSLRGNRTATELGICGYIDGGAR